MTAFPCPRFPVVDRRVPPIDQSDGEGPLLAATAVGVIERRFVEFPLADLHQDQVDDLLVFWGDGAGLYTPFSYTLPGDTLPRDWIFADDALSIAHRTGVAAGTVVRLIDVTEPGT